MDTLKEYVKEISMLSKGYPFEYDGYVLKAVGGGGSPEIAVINPETGNQIENLTAPRFDKETQSFERFNDCEDGFQGFKNKLDEIIEYDPDTMREWLDR